MPLRVTKTYRAAIVRFMQSGKPRFARVLHEKRKLVREMQRAGQYREVPTLTAEEEVFLTAISTSGNFTREKALQLYDVTGGVRGNRDDVAKAFAHVKVDDNERCRGFTGMNTEEFGYKEYKCPKCGWVHAAIPLYALPADTALAQYLRCFNCRSSTETFVPAGPDDAPDGCTLQPVIVQGAWQ